MRITGLVAPLLASAALLSGCSPADARKAETILAQAQRSAQSLKTETFLIKLDMSAAGQSGEVDLQGGLSRTDGREGDFYVTMTGSLPDGTAVPSTTVVERGGSVVVEANGRTETLPVARGTQQTGGTPSGVTNLMDLARFVKGGSVGETDFQGRPADKLVGILDTQSLLTSASTLFDRLGVHLGDVRVVLYVPRDTHLVEAMIAHMSMTADGQSATVTMSLAVTGVNQPLTFPNV
jgi:hypothetical protein